MTFEKIGNSEKKVFLPGKLLFFVTKTTRNMKKVLTLAVVAAMFGFAACGPSEEDKAKAEEAANELIENLGNAVDEAVEEEAVEAVEEEAVEEDTTAAEEAVEEVSNEE